MSIKHPIIKIQMCNHSHSLFSESNCFNIIFGKIIKKFLQWHFVV